MGRRTPGALLLLRTSPPGAGRGGAGRPGRIIQHDYPKGTFLLSTRQPSHDLALKRILTDIELFSRHVIGRPLRPYQLEPARAIIRSVLEHQD